MHNTRSLIYGVVNAVEKIMLLINLFFILDSFVLSIHRENWVESLKKIEDWFDFSNLDKSHPLYSTKNKNVLGLFKLETKNAKILGRDAKRNLFIL